MLNHTVAGDYDGLLYYEEVKDKKTRKMVKRMFISEAAKGLFKKNRRIYITKETVESYEEIGSESQKSLRSGVARGVVGGALFGGIGAIAGASSGKSKTSHTVSILFKDGTKCLCELDNDMYKNLVMVLY